MALLPSPAFVVVGTVRLLVSPRTERTAAHMISPIRSSMTSTLRERFSVLRRRRCLRMLTTLLRSCRSARMGDRAPLRGPLLQWSALARRRAYPSWGISGTSIAPKTRVLQGRSYAAAAGGLAYDRGVAHFALSPIGHDRPGIVAEVTGTLLEHEVNIEDSQMAILRGHFTMTLIVSAPELIDIRSLRADLERTRAALGLDAITLSRV